MIEFSRSACPAMMRTKRRAASGSSSAPSSSVSAKPLIEVTGVLSSCETLATKSRRTASSLLRRVTSFSTTTAPTSSPSSSPCSNVPLAWRLRSSAPTRMTMSASTGLWPPSVCATTCWRSGLRTTSWMDLPSAAAGSVSSRRAAAALTAITRSSVSTARTPSTMLASTASRSLRSCVSRRSLSSSSSAIWLMLSATEANSSTRGTKSLCEKSPAARRSAPTLICRICPLMRRDT